MHPIVREFIDSSVGISSIVEKYHDKGHFLERVFLDLTKSMNIEKVENQFYIDLDQAIVTGHSDSSLYYFFISFSIQFLCIRRHTDRAIAIHSISTSLPGENIHPVLQSYYTGAVGFLRFDEGKFEEGDQLLKKSIAMIDKKSPRYITILGIVISLIGVQGRLNELEKEDIKLMDEEKDEYRVNAFLYTKLSNAIVNGNFKSGYALIGEFKSRFVGDRVFIFKEYTNLLKLLSGDFEKNNYEDEFFKYYVGACSALAQGDSEEALKIYLFIPKNIFPVAISSSFYQYFPLHIELSLKNKGKARLLLQEISQEGGFRFMDDFFLARLQLLEMNREGANETFARLIENVNRYDAMNRLLFELQFAKEMQVADIIMLTNRMRNTEFVKPPLTKKPKATILALPEKGVELLIGDSLVVSQLKKLVKKFAILREPVLITGETGTGKELVSRAIHEEGLYSKEPFMAINCGALTESLLESELFGYESGAFTGAQKERKGIFEATGKGTVFLDEFGDISPKMQVSLLRVLESNEIRLIGGTKTRQVECKIVIATNLDLQKAVEEKRFREDLYFRLNRFDIQLPPLRERVEDIPKLINYFLKDVNERNGNQKLLSKSLLEALMAYHWPGNIRELKNEIERLKILQPDKEILNLEDFDFSHLQGAAPDNIKNKIEVQQVKSIIPKINKQSKELPDDQILKIVHQGSKVDQRQEYIAGLFRKYKKLTRRQIIEITNVSPVTATNDLNALCQAGMIERRAPTKSVKSHYFVFIEKSEESEVTSTK